MKKLSILAIFATLVSFSACTTAVKSDEEKKKEDSTKVVEKVDTTATKTEVDTTAAKH